MNVKIIPKNLPAKLDKYSVCNLKYSIPKEVNIIFHNGSNYVYHFVMKELTEELEGQFTCLGEHTEKYLTFSVSVEKEI